MHSHSNIKSGKNHIEMEYKAWKIRWSQGWSQDTKYILDHLVHVPELATNVALSFLFIYDFISLFSLYIWRFHKIRQLDQLSSSLITSSYYVPKVTELVLKFDFGDKAPNFQPRSIPTRPHCILNTEKFHARHPFSWTAGSQENQSTSGVFLFVSLYPGDWGWKRVWQTDQAPEGPCLDSPT